MRHLSYKLRSMAVYLDRDVAPTEEDRRAMREAADLLDNSNLAKASAYLLERTDLVDTGAAGLNPPQVFNVVLRLLRSLSERGIDVPRVLDVLAHNLRTGEIDQEEVNSLVAELRERP